MKLKTVIGATAMLITAGCAHKSIEEVPAAEAARLDPKLVREAVIYEPGAESCTAVPEISAPRLRVTMAPKQRIENGKKIVEKRCEWTLEGDVVILDFPSDRQRVSSKDGGRSQ